MKKLILFLTILAMLPLATFAQTTTNFPNGISTQKTDSALGLIPMADPSKVFSVFDEFDTTNTLATNIWSSTSGVYSFWVGSSTGVAPTAAISSGTHSLLCLTNDGADNDCTMIQQQQAWFDTGPYGTGKMWFKTRLAFQDVDAMDAVIGLVNASAGTGDILGTSSQVKDGIGFALDDGVTTLNYFTVSANDTIPSSAAAFATASVDGSAKTSLADGTFYKLEFVYDGSIVKYYVDGTLVGISSSSIPTDTPLCLTVGLQNGEAAAKNVTIDYIFAACEREF